MPPTAPSRAAALLLVPLLLGAALAGCAKPAPTPPHARPNFIILLADDARYDAIDWMPLTKKALFDGGVSFSQAFLTTPLCCPSRSSILTGEYAHDHHVLKNYDALGVPTVVPELHDAGYRTGVVGKYLNSYHAPPRPEFDTWEVLPSPMYENPTLIENNGTHEYKGYMTDVLVSKVQEFLAGSKNDSRPFFLLYAPNVPHLPSIPSAQDAGLYQNLSPYRPPSFNVPLREEGMPNFLRTEPLNESEIAANDALRLNMTRTLAALDRSDAAILDALRASGHENDTVVFWLSDNGWFFGEHALYSKDRLYEEAIRTPFAIRAPGIAAPDTTSDALVANIDIAPTMLDLAGLPIPGSIDGRSLAPILRGQPFDRKELLIEAWAGDEVFTGLRTSQYAYIESWFNDTKESRILSWTELYDVKADPYELHDLAREPAYRQTVADLAARHEALSPRAQMLWAGPPPAGVADER